MTVQYNWQISQIEVVKTQGELSNVAQTIHWRLDGHEDGLTSGVYGAVTLADADPANFVNFESLTHDQVVAWIESALGTTLDDYKNKIVADIEQLKNPPIATLPPPWLTITPPAPQ